MDTTVVFQTWDEVFASALENCDDIHPTLYDAVYKLAECCNNKVKILEYKLDINKFNEHINPLGVKLPNRSNASIPYAIAKCVVNDTEYPNKNDREEAVDHFRRGISGWFSNSVDGKDDDLYITSLQKFNDRDIYNNLIRIVFALRLTYDEYDKLMDDLKARKLYSLDCRECVFLLAIKYNEKHPDKRINFNRAKEIAQDAPKIILSRIEEEADAWKLNYPECSDTEAYAAAVRMLYLESHEEYDDAYDKKEGGITEYTRFINKKIVSEISESDLPFDSVVSRFLRENTGAILRSRVRYHALIAEAIYGNADFSKPNPERCRWIAPDDANRIIAENNIIKSIQQEFSQRTQSLPNEYQKSVYSRTPANNQYANLSLFFMKMYKTPRNSDFMSLIETVTDIDGVPEELYVREDIIGMNIKKGSLPPFADATRSFLVDNIGFRKGPVPANRDDILAFCACTGKIFRDEVNDILEAAGEPPLNGKFLSDREFIAVDTLVNWYQDNILKGEAMNSHDDYLFYWQLLEAIQKASTTNQNVKEVFAVGMLSDCSEIDPHEYW